MIEAPARELFLSGYRSFAREENKKIWAEVEKAVESASSRLAIGSKSGLAATPVLQHGPIRGRTNLVRKSIPVLFVQAKTGRHVGRQDSISRDMRRTHVQIRITSGCFVPYCRTGTTGSPTMDWSFAAIDKTASWLVRTRTPQILLHECHSSGVFRLPGLPLTFIQSVAIFGAIHGCRFPFDLQGTGARAAESDSFLELIVS
ncbi:uncharacterized protein DFL_000111 [Arthrobotrys flagrans]|uniref:Uncharacterized protein n=1 Tax=Arthrobotrys flagrans TaxID=97331 RepID=A0A437ACU1_ARTFL|nr:hypothetical protein DFL_000111 [Arthrobotrys flagrans]